MLKTTELHPVGTTYDVLVPGSAARRRGVPLAAAILAFKTMRNEGADPIVVAHLPNGVRVVGCTGAWDAA